MIRNFTTEETLIDQLVTSDTDAFEEIHRRYCYPLYAYCISKLCSPADARLIVRDIFIRLWEKRESLPVNFRLGVHLYTEVRREVINCLNEKLVTETDLCKIEKDVLPGFSVDKLKEARKPVKKEHPGILYGASRPKPTAQPWWNHYPDFAKTRGMKLALEKILHMF